MAKVKLTVTMRYFFEFLFSVWILSFFHLGWWPVVICASPYSCVSFHIGIRFPNILLFFQLSNTFRCKQQWMPFYFATFDSILFHSRYSTFWHLPYVLHCLLYAAIKFWNILRCYLVELVGASFSLYSIFFFLFSFHLSPCSILGSTIYCYTEFAACYKFS